MCDILCADIWKSINTICATMCSYILHNVAGQGERHYLRILLGVVKGATSFASLRTHNGVEHDNFK